VEIDDDVVVGINQPAPSVDAADGAQPEAKNPVRARADSKNKPAFLALPLSLVIRLLRDDKFEPGVRPQLLTPELYTWIFKESVSPGSSRMTKRPCGGDAWINSGGARGGRSLRDEDGNMIVRRRYGKIVAFSAGGRAALKRGAGVLRDSDPSLGDCRQEWRYQEYNLLKHGQDGQVVEDRDVRLYHILPPDSVPMLGIPSSIHLTGAERAYLHAVSVYASNQAKGLAEQSEPHDPTAAPDENPNHGSDGGSSPAAGEAGAGAGQREAKRPRPGPVTRRPKPYPRPQGRLPTGANPPDPPTGMESDECDTSCSLAALSATTGLLPVGFDQSELAGRLAGGTISMASQRLLNAANAALMLMDANFNPGWRPSHLPTIGDKPGFMFKESAKRRRSRTEERWVSFTSSKASHDVVMPARPLPEHLRSTGTSAADVERFVGVRRR
jgi:hypothetical protein